MSLSNIISINKQEAFDFIIYKPLNIDKNIKKYNIMVIDDDKKNILLLKDLLLSETILSFSLSSWTNSHQAILALENEEILPDLLFLDLIMPGVNGETALKRLKELANTKNIPIIIYSSMNSYPNASKFSSLDACAFFSKPLNTFGFRCYLHS